MAIRDSSSESVAAPTGAGDGEVASSSTWSLAVAGGPGGVLRTTAV
jgi:hypothetical protein